MPLIDRIHLPLNQQTSFSWRSRLHVNTGSYYIALNRIDNTVNRKVLNAFQEETIAIIERVRSFYPASISIDDRNKTTYNLLLSKPANYQVEISHLNGRKYLIFSVVIRLSGFSQLPSQMAHGLHQFLISTIRSFGSTYLLKHGTIADDFFTQCILAYCRAHLKSTHYEQSI